MALFNAGLIIREVRAGKGLTQTQLAEGICSRQTISGIENGERKPDWFIFKAIATRLGLNPDDYYNGIASENDVYLVQKVQECVGYIQTFNFDAVKKLTEEMEADRKFLQCGDMAQTFLLRFKANLYAQGTYKDSTAAKAHALACLRINRPDFEVEKITDYYLSDDECILISLLAIIIKDLEGLPKALEIWLALKQNYEKNYKLNNFTQAYRDLCTNIAMAFKHLERFEECLKAAEEGITQSLSYHDMRTYSRYLYLKGWSLLKLGRTEEGEEVYKKFLLFAYVVDGYAAINFETVKKEYTEAFHNQLELSAPWHSPPPEK